MRTNKPIDSMRGRTHEGAPAYSNMSPMQALRRSVLSCFLFEGEFYEDGVSIATRIAEAARLVTPEELAALAIEARHRYNLRHVPLWLLKVLAEVGRGRSDGLVRRTVEATIGRADELAEFLALYWRDGKKPLSGQIKKGLAAAFHKFDGYQLAKYNRDATVKLRDVLFLTHAKPTQVNAETWKQLIDGTLKAPDTWEVALSGGADKKETFTRLLEAGTLGYMALLRNLRNMEQVGVDRELIKSALLNRWGAHKVLPFRFIAAAKAVPNLEPVIDTVMLATLEQAPKLRGKTVVIIDVSGSMYNQSISAKSDMDRATAACALGAIARELCEEPIIFATAGSDFSRTHKTEQVPPRRGMALVDAIYGLCRPLGGGGIFLRQACDHIRPIVGNADRTIVITDEQDCDIGNKKIAAPIGKGYLINVASYKNGIGYGAWTHIDGFSERVFDYILESE